MKMNLGGIQRKNPENKSERVHKFVIEHKAVSGFTVAFIFLAFWKILPFSVLGFLPETIRRFTVFFIMANLIAWIPARYSYRKLRELPADILYVVNPADKQKVRKGFFLQGKFQDEFDLKNGRPFSWTDSSGTTCYMMIGIDEDEQVAYCPPYGDYGPDKLLAFENAWKQQRIKNDKERRVGSQLRMKAGQLKSQIIGAVSNVWIRDLEKIQFEETIEKEVDDILPDDIRPEIDIDPNNLEDLENVAVEPDSNLRNMTEDASDDV